MRRDDALRYARLLSYGRIALGATALLAPRLPLWPWVGDGESRRPAAKMLARSLGARDLALGIGPVLAMRHDAPVRGWIEAGGLADAGDVVTTLVAWRHLPRRTRVVMLVIVAGSMAACRILSSAAD
ncbi:MAG TPA: hypothetical protein VFJ85_07680 [Acidimicrobiales bacterium]|nr:hypothetical protein [Acidimicrobiales bacterium]